MEHDRIRRPWLVTEGPSNAWAFRAAISASAEGLLGGKTLLRGNVPRGVGPRVDGGSAHDDHGPRVTRGVSTDARDILTPA